MGSNMNAILRRHGSYTLSSYTIDAELMRDISAANLVRAASADDLEGVRLVLQRGVDPNRQDVRGDTALHRAVRRGRLAIAQLLLEHGADVNARNRKRQTPLHAALAAHKIREVKFLLENGANPNLRDKHGATALHLACTFRDADFARVLLAFGADIEEKNFYGNGNETPLHIACRRGQFDTIKVLVRKGADINFLHKDETTPQNSAFVRGSWRLWYGENWFPYDAIQWLLHNVAKLHSAGMYVCRENIESLDDGPINLCMSTDIRPQCAEEVAKMKEEEVYKHPSGDVIYLYDVLVSRVDALAALFRRHPLRESLRSTGFEGKYPQYADILSTKIKNAEWKVALRENCLTFLYGMYPELPLLCAELICSYLSEADMRMLFCACRPEDFYSY